MKVPSPASLKRANSEAQRGSGSLYRSMLLSVVPQWTKLSGDASLEQCIRSWDVPRMIGSADSLVSQKFDTADLHFAANQIAALIRKYPWTPKESLLDPEKTAVETFLASERKCKRVNTWFRARRSRVMKNRPWSGAFLRAQNWIRYVLRDTPNLRTVYDMCDFTAGAGIGVHGDLTNLGRKLLAESWTVTPTARPYLASALCANFHYASRTGAMRGGVQCLQVSETDLDTCTTLVDYNKVGFVPKTAKTHRVIAVEPLGNNFLQKGVDMAMRGYLRRVGLDLRWQEPNQRMAREGSFDGDDSFVTIDLSSASDSIATEFVKELLPPDWFAFLCRIRSPSYRLPKSDVSVTYEKFVTMGNGFCFPLQTLLFASLIHAVQPDGVPGRDFRVYGDDIIVRKSIAREVIALLARCGFTTNSRKTFLNGPFRESCGSNWYSGEDVTPMTLDRKLDSIQSLFKFVNQARRNERCSSFLEVPMTLVFKAIPDQFLFVRPFKGRPETGIDPFGLEFTPHWCWNRHYQCHQWLELDATPVEDRIATGPAEGWVVMAAALRGNPSSKPFVARRKVVTRVRRVARSGPEGLDP